MTMTNKEIHKKYRAVIRKDILLDGESPASMDTDAQLEAFCRINELDNISDIPSFIETGRPVAPAEQEEAPAKPKRKKRKKRKPTGGIAEDEPVELTGRDEAPAEQAAPQAPDVAKAIAGSLEHTLQDLLKPQVDEEKIIKLIHEHSQSALHIEVKQYKKPETTKIANAHKKMPLALSIVELSPVTAQNLYMVGGAGSGKTTLGIQIATALDLPFYSTGAIFDKFELLGFNDVNGNYVETELYKAYTQGGVFLFDEIDASAPECLTAFNQLLANEQYCFPNGMQSKHENFRAIAAANTNGLGATGAYGTRATIDGATLDRFFQVTIEYDEQLEDTISHAAAAAVNPEYNKATVDKWIKTVRKARKWLEDNNSDVIASPRASKGGAAMLAAGHDIETVKEVSLFAHLSEDQRRQLAAA